MAPRMDDLVSELDRRAFLRAGAYWALACSSLAASRRRRRKRRFRPQKI